MSTNKTHRKDSKINEMMYESGTIIFCGKNKSPKKAVGILPIKLARVQIVQHFIRL